MIRMVSDSSGYWWVLVGTGGCWWVLVGSCGIGGCGLFGEQDRHGPSGRYASTVRVPVDGAGVWGGRFLVEISRTNDSWTRSTTTCTGPCSCRNVIQTGVMEVEVPIYHAGHGSQWEYISISLTLDGTVNSTADPSCQFILHSLFDLHGLVLFGVCACALGATFPTL